MPANVRVERYIPQTVLLPHCSVVVSHAGSGTLLASLSSGLPQLCLPGGGPVHQRPTGRRISLLPDEVDAASVAAAVERLLVEPSFSQGAKAVGREIARMPGPGEVVGVLEDAAAGLSVDGRPGLGDVGLTSDGRHLYALDADAGVIFGWAVGAGGHARSAQAPGRPPADGGGPRGRLTRARPPGPPPVSTATIDPVRRDEILEVLEVRPLTVADVEADREEPAPETDLRAEPARA